MRVLSHTLRLALEDLLGDLRHARRVENVGRMALLAWCDVRRWARQAGDDALAECSSRLVMQTPCATRAEFVAQVDELIARLAAVHAAQADAPLELPSPGRAARGGGPAAPLR